MQYRYPKQRGGQFLRHLFFPTLLALLTGVLLTLSFPSPDQGWVAWFALVPLVCACHERQGKPSFFLGLLSGFLATSGIFHWILKVQVFQWPHFLLLVLLALFFAAYTALWCVGLSFLRDLSLPLLLTAPALWVSLEYLRAHAGFVALPWTILAHSQHSNLALIQIASYTGEYGISFLIVMANIGFSEAILQNKWKGLIIAFCTIALVHSWGTKLVRRGSEADRLKVAVIQPNIPLSEANSYLGETIYLSRLEGLTITVAKYKPALFVWPETAVTDFHRRDELVMQLRKISKAANAPLLVGSSDYIAFPSKNRSPPGGLIFMIPAYNAAYFISPESPGGPLAKPYRKRILVPFGEYLPFPSLTKKLPDWLIPKFFESLPGNEYRTYIIHKGIKVSPIICWENIFADYVRQLVREEQPHLIVQLTNDNWFGHTAAPYQHNIASVFRAVENRVPIAIASNTGPSWVIDPMGRVVAEVEGLFIQGAAVGEVSLRNDVSFYTKNGDLFVFMCIVLVMIVGLSTAFLRTQDKKTV